MEKALKLRRPFDEPLPLDESNLKAISLGTRTCEGGNAQSRDVEVLRYESSGACREERALHRSLDESLRPVLALKRLILLKEKKC